MSLTYYSPLRYPGGKSRFARFIQGIMDSNDLTSGHYMEPYAGGAAVALALLFSNTASHIHINDVDTAVYDFWIAVVNETDTFLKLLHDTPVTMDQWLHWRSVMRREVVADQTERGFATFFMNRTNRSGILKGGVIGGFKQDGEYLLDARFNKDDLAKRIERIAKFSKKISVYNEDALSLLKRCNDILPENSLIFLDPPYYVKGKGLYRNFYEHKDHVAIANQIRSKDFKRKWVVSYDDAPEIQKIYRRRRTLQYDISYTAQDVYFGSEIMFFSRGLKVPEAENPTRIKSPVVRRSK